MNRLGRGGLVVGGTGPPPGPPQSASRPEIHKPERGRMVERGPPVGVSA
eukprot:CAMPEP_0177631840 /NCGR_PEP_ID=MMETSP0447-20121125/1960_1 /TAXON_ID=0 /ORGANISM="Stygamoeba regulata, Strain BSH-02190019" /LENGTH=48 /DNA_ID= /DNA_START= /DNA_END= /DNA_ORIENTATION=